ncbi:hypothetical protein JCM11491_005157 [Sporobolomyces phaffii]
MHLILSAALTALLSASLALCGTTGTVFAAVDAGLDRTDYSTFWRSLEGDSPLSRQPGAALTDSTGAATGLSLDVQPYEAAATKLRQDGDRVGHLIIFGSAVKGLPAELSPQRLSSLLDRGTNILLALPPNASDVWRDFAREFEIDIADRGAEAVDHFEHDLDADHGSHTSLVLPLGSASTPFLSSSTAAGAPVLYRGALHSNGRSPLVHAILGVPSTTYSGQADLPLEDLRYYGGRAAAVSGFQARNNARLAIVGSLDVFTDVAASSPVRTESASYSQSGNSAFLDDLARWTFGLTGQRRVVSVQHGISGTELSNPVAYRVGDKVHYVLDLETSEAEAPEDLQLEVTMLDPHLRIPLVSHRVSERQQRFEAFFTLPDRHGVFTLRVDHRRPGWSNIESTTVVSITPPRHDEYERFIRGAAPYYGGALSVSIGLLAFVFFWIVQS